LERRRFGARVTDLDELERELARVGIRGRLRRRIVAEIADHLASDPEANLGAAADLAGRFADELGTSRSRRAAYAVFAALALAGAAYCASFVALNVTGPVHASSPRTPFVAALALATIIVAPQVAFVAGALAALRAFRHRRDVAVAAAEARVLRRRSAVALAAGTATMGAVALAAFEYEAGLPGWTTTLAYACSAAGGAALAAATPAVVAAARLHPRTPGEAGDMFADLGPLVPSRLRERPWPFARAVATLLFLVVTAAGVAQSDPFDGALRGLAEAAAV